jgi:hypothetical protein
MEDVVEDDTENSYYNIQDDMFDDDEEDNVD